MSSNNINNTNNNLYPYLNPMHRRVQTTFKIDNLSMVPDINIDNQSIELHKGDKKQQTSLIGGTNSETKSEIDTVS